MGKHTPGENDVVVHETQLVPVEEAGAREVSPNARVWLRFKAVVRSVVVRWLGLIDDEQLVDRLARSKVEMIEAEVRKTQAEANRANADAVKTLTEALAVFEQSEAHRPSETRENRSLDDLKRELHTALTKIQIKGGTVEFDIDLLSDENGPDSGHE